MEVVKSMFMVYKFFYCDYGEYIWEESEIILFFFLNFACHEAVIKTQGNFISITNDSRYQTNVTNVDQRSTVYDECDGPKKRPTICLKDGYTFLVTTKSCLHIYI